MTELTAIPAWVWWAALAAVWSMCAVVAFAVVDADYPDEVAAGMCLFLGFMPFWHWIVAYSLSCWAWSVFAKKRLCPKCKSHY